MTKCTFEYGTTTLDKTAPCATLPGSGSSPEAVTAAIGSLSANTTYHFKIVAENASSKGEGSEETFKTTAAAVSPPTAVTGKASEVTETSATLNATVNPNGTAVTKCTFEYGTTTLDKTAPCATLPGSGSSPEAVTAAIGSLSANTTYHFKIVAENASSKGEGSEETLKTSGTTTASPEEAIRKLLKEIDAAGLPHGIHAELSEVLKGRSATFRQRVATGGTDATAAMIAMVSARFAMSTRTCSSSSP